MHVTFMLVLPQPVYQEFASLRPPLGGRTRLVQVKYTRCVGFIADVILTADC